MRKSRTKKIGVVDVVYVKEKKKKKRVILDNCLVVARQQDGHA